jgi:DNA-binding PadR family transcriptional regulator
VAKVETTGHRSKAIYEITDKGEKEYRKLLVESFRHPSVSLPVQLYTGLSMLVLPNHQADLSAVIEAAEAQIKALSAKMEEIKEGQRIKAAFMGVNELTKLAFQNMLDHYKLQIDFLEKIIKLIKA